MKSWIAAAAVYKDRRMLTILFLGFSSGLPSPLLFFNLTIWLKDEGFSYAGIGLFSLVGTAYAVNFLWAPLIDRLSLGAFTRCLGRRRSWALLSQIALMASIFCMGFLGPSAGLPPRQEPTPSHAPPIASSGSFPDRSSSTSRDTSCRGTSSDGI